MEIDLIEEHGGKLRGFEFKWNPSKKPKPPKEWLTTYRNASYTVVTRDTYQAFVLPD